MQRIRQPRVAELVASRLRDDILTGRLTEGDVLPSQEALFAEFGVSPPAVREAVHILESDGLISVRRGNVGGHKATFSCRTCSLTETKCRKASAGWATCSLYA